MAARAACSCLHRAGTLPDLFIYREEEENGGGGGRSRGNELTNLRRFETSFVLLLLFDDSLIFGLVLRRLEKRL